MSAPERSLVWPEEGYADLDPGIRFAVRVLHARGIETGQSCQGGDGHAYDHPTVDLLSGARPVGFAALAALEDYGLRVRDVSLCWPVDRGLPTENFWRITLCQAWPDRADEVPMFAWYYRTANRHERFNQCDARLAANVFSHYAYGDPLPVYARYVGEDGDVTEPDAITVWVRCEREAGHDGQHLARGTKGWSEAANSHSESA